MLCIWICKTLKFSRANLTHSTTISSVTFTTAYWTSAESSTSAQSCAPKCPIVHSSRHADWPITRLSICTTKTDTSSSFAVCLTPNANTKITARLLTPKVISRRHLSTRWHGISISSSTILKRNGAPSPMTTIKPSVSTRTTGRTLDANRIFSATRRFNSVKSGKLVTLLGGMRTGAPYKVTAASRTAGKSKCTTQLFLRRSRVPTLSSVKISCTAAFTTRGPRTGSSPNCWRGSCLTKLNLNRARICTIWPCQIQII